MKQLNQLFTKIANDHLGVSSLRTRQSDSFDFHNVPVWGIHAALKAAYMAGAQSNRPIASELMEAVEYIAATLKLRHLDEATDDQVDEAVSIGRSILARAKRLMPKPPYAIQPSGTAEPAALLRGHSLSPWAYEYNPYTVQRGVEPGVELAAFEVCDAEGNKLFHTNEDMPSEVQEANARLAASAPELLAILDRCAMLLADYDEHDGEEGEAYRDAVAVITAVTTGKTEL